MVEVREYGDKELVLRIMNDLDFYKTFSYYTSNGFGWDRYFEDMLSTFDASNCQWRELKKYYIETREELSNG